MDNQNQTSSTQKVHASIIRLDDTVVNQIAAGEVIERPASVIKELMENAIDAGADRIDVVTANGGKTLMRVKDNGFGMGPDALVMAIERHCTSKLSRDLMDIRSLGFRGEALPSIGSVSRLAISSRADGTHEGWSIDVTGGKSSDIKPSPISEGTSVEVTDLFFATPARLKFLKSDQAEANAISDVFKRIALAFPAVRFSLSGSDRTGFDYRETSQTGRIEQVLGKEFSSDSITLDAEREGVRLSGQISVPTYHRGNAQAQYFFVNGRPVRDKALLGAVRGAYMDFLPRGRHPMVVLFIDIDPHLVDVNVHPAKADVRFRDAGLVRGLLVGSIKQALSQQGPLTSRTGAAAMAQAFRKEPPQSSSFADWARPADNNPATGHGFAGMTEAGTAYDPGFVPASRLEPIQASEVPDAGYPLGSARAQLHKNYIVSQTQTGLVIVDQHAAHERIVYEKLKAGMRDGLASQLLLVPEIVDLPEEDVNRLCQFTDAFGKLGLELEAFGPGAVAVRGTPSLLGETDTQQLIRDLADEIAEWDTAEGLSERLEHVAATMACHGSVRSGRILNGSEMNSLLRQMEQTPNSGQCNHGRPTYIELDLKDIERLFGR